MKKIEDNYDCLGRFAGGNKLSEKWHYKACAKKLKQILKILADDLYESDDKGKPTTTSKEPEIYIMSQLVTRAGVSTNWLRQMEQKFVVDKGYTEEECEDVQETIQIIKDIMESRVWTGTSNMSINSHLGIFTLKAYHNRIERQYVESKNENNNNNTGEVKLNIIYPEKKQ